MGQNVIMLRIATKLVENNYMAADPIGPAIQIGSIQCADFVYCGR